MEAARQLFESLAVDDFAILPRDANWMIGTALLVLAARRFGDTGAEAVLYERLAPYPERLVMIGFGGVTWGPVAYYLGILAAALGDDERAEGHLRNAAEFCRTVGAVTWAARAQDALTGLAPSHASRARA